MSINAYQEQVFFFYILDNQHFLNLAKSDYFINPIIRELFDIAKEYALKYKEAPSKDQMIQLVKIKGLSEKYNDDVITALFNTKQLLGEYEDKWLDDNIPPWIQVRNLDNVMRKAVAFMKTTKIIPENASEVVEKIRHMLITESALDFSFEIGTDFFDSTSHLQTRLARTSSGYKYIDLCLNGGYWKGSYIVFLGAPKTGKTTWLCNLAAKSVEMGHNTAYISFELQREMIHMKIGANLLNIPLSEYAVIAEDQNLLKKKLNALKRGSLKPLGNLHVQEFGSSTCSVNDLTAYLKKTEEILGYKFENIFIDYINIMKNWRNPNTENTYMKIKQISEDLRAMAMEEQWATISVTQTNKGGWENSDLNIRDIAESGALLHTVDALFGIITDPEMKARGEYYLKYLADRVSGLENTKKRYIIDWKFARIDEDDYSPIQDMDFLINSTYSPKRHNTPRGGKTGDIHSIISENVIPEIPIDDQRIKDINITGDGLF